MSKEEMIDIAEKIANFGWSDYDDFEINKKAIQGLLDLYNKEKEKNKNSVSKDKVKEKINFLKEVLAFAETGRDEKATIQANLLKNIIIEMEKLLED